MHKIKKSLRSIKFIGIGYIFDIWLFHIGRIENSGVQNDMLWSRNLKMNALVQTLFYCGSVVFHNIQKMFPLNVMCMGI